MSTWHIDQAHSQIAFKVKHLVISTARGSFKSFKGHAVTEGDALEGASISFEADVNSIDTNSEYRDSHLKGPDFFDAANFPTINFVSKSFVKKTDEEFELIGDLTMRGVTKPVTLTATYNGATVGMNGKKVVGFEITGSVNRFDFGLNWNEVLEAGGVAVGEKVTFDILIEAVEE